MTFPTYKIVGGPRSAGTKIIDSLTGHELRGVNKLTLIADASDKSGLWRAEIVLLGVEVDITVPRLTGICAARRAAMPRRPSMRPICWPTPIPRSPASTTGPSWWR